MTASELAAILDRLEALGPRRRLSDKHQRLSEVRQRLLALHGRGHSWRAIASELSAGGEKVSADLLRAICLTKPKRRAAKGNRPTEAPAQPTRIHASAPVTAPAPANGKTDGRFGARGLKP